MQRITALCVSSIALLGVCSLNLSSFSVAGQTPQTRIRGEYLEARTCDVYTGPCFANAEMGLAGKEALIAWKVDEGLWRSVDLTGLSVAVVLNAEGTLGDDGIFGMNAGEIRSVILVDERASVSQRKALIDFAKNNAKDLTSNVVKIVRVPLQLNNDHATGRATFSAGDLARIETRGMQQCDCVCTNEIVYYQPLTQVHDFEPVYTKTISFRGEGLNNKWTTHEIRSAFIAKFER